jgi:hypothetical protein
MDRLYCCLLGHLYHLARGELLRLGSALRLPEAAAAAAGSASILQLGKAAFAPAAPNHSSSSSSTAAGSRGGTMGGTCATQASGTTIFSTGSAGAAKQRADSKERDRDRPSSLNTAAAGSSSSSSANLSADVELLREAAASGGLGPRMVAQLQELLLTPLCGFSQMINKYADGSGGALTYEVHTPKLGLDEVGLNQVRPRFDSGLTQQRACCEGRGAWCAAGRVWSVGRIHCVAV